MKKAIALVGKGYSAQSIAEGVVKAFGTARNILVRIGAADPIGQQKVAIGPIIGEANEEFLQDFLDVTDGVVIAHFETMVGSPSVRGSIELELETSAMPDLQPYVAPEASETAQAEPVVQEPARPQAKEDEKQNQERFMSVAELIKDMDNICTILEFDDETRCSILALAIQKASGVTKTEIRFKDGSSLRQVNGQLEVA